PPPEVETRGARWREANAPRRPVWVAGSTHDGEEDIILDAHQRLLGRIPDALLLLVPRHPQRFDAVRDRLTRRGAAFTDRSTGIPVAESTAILLGDTMGELMDFYASADVAFVGGSLVPAGGHNLLEPASLGRPILTGPNYFNSEAIARLLLDAGAVRIVRDARGLEHEVAGLLGSAEKRATMGAAGRAVLDANRGALDRLLNLVDPLL
ncbi:MAG: hypothetical protein ACREB5_11035, partial [Sphingomonadaceae bacterium]